MDYQHKRCGKCDTIKHKAEFFKCKGTADGCQYFCISCEYAARKGMMGLPRGPQLVTVKSGWRRPNKKNCSECGKRLNSYNKSTHCHQCHEAVWKLHVKTVSHNGAEVGQKGMG